MNRGHEHSVTCSFISNPNLGPLVYFLILRDQIQSLDGHTTGTIRVNVPQKIYMQMYLRRCSRMD
ncbi:hypothetical protein Hanom_Chr17g01591731 [Helianthus anomalus]